MVELKEHASEFLMAAGCDLTEMTAAISLAHMLNGYGNSTVFRVAAGDDKVAWCRMCQDGELTCVAIAPRDSIFTDDAVPLARFFYDRPWPPEWSWWRKADSSVQPGNGGASKLHDPVRDNGFAWRVSDDGICVDIAWVVSAQPLMLLTSPDAPHPVCGGAEWKALPEKHDKGMRQVFERGFVKQPSVGMACSWAARYALSNEAKEQKRAERAAKGPSAAQVAARAKWAKAMQEGRKRKAAERRGEVYAPPTPSDAASAAENAAERQRILAAYKPHAASDELYERWANAPDEHVVNLLGKQYPKDD